MAELKTKKNDGDVEAFIDGIDPKKQDDCRTILAMMKDITGEEPAMWGESIIGFGSYHFKYASGREGDWMLTGFSPRKQNFSLYIMAGFDQYEPLMEQLGKHKTGKSCLYINKLADIDQDILRELITRSIAHTEKHGGC